ncbi:MAG: hypothetical protein IJC89_03900 [Clostridia bacterium]|nr:hypothetical protein [Clostridia bacterium]
MAILLILCIGIMIFTFSGKNNNVKKETSIQRNEIEIRLEKILSGVQGAGQVEVMIVFKSDGKEDIAMNTQYSRDEDGKIKSEQSAVLSSNREAIVVQKKIPDVQGVIIIAEGADDEEVRENLKKATVAVLPVLSHRIEVFTKAKT